ncbi:site-specific integrase [Shewanella acanthi]|uniref:site-specific integrase n=1 Tax=Shewanella acanthi TaxID=2864212 RepID=UPI001C65F5C6|nr:site-specific integrase [Shewanella acanthi]QYJ79938.1 site-specific integrase [Shewanella acanthi]
MSDCKINDLKIKEEAQKIQQFFEWQSIPCAPIEDFAWVLQHWPSYFTKERKLSDEQIKEAKGKIGQVPTGKQKLYRQALNEILQYLADSCNWELPEQVQQKLTDKDHQWLEKIAPELGNASRLYQCYQSEKITFYEKRNSMSVAFITLAIAFEIAPLNLAHISQVLNCSDSIDYSQAKPRLKIWHLKQDEVTAYFTHYYLSLVSERLLSDYYAQRSSKVTEAQLLEALNQFAAQNNLPAAIRFQWQHRFQIFWFVHYAIPPTFLKDLSYPERHVGFSKLAVPIISGASANIYNIDWDLEWFTHLTAEQNKKYRPHKELLLKQPANSNTSAFKPSWEAGDILPNMLYLYTEQLLTLGGVKKSKLALSSIVKYTSFEKLLEQYPLPYVDAVHEDSLNNWAVKVFNAAESDSAQLMIYYFLKFISVQELTESLDISDFTYPTNRPTVSAFCLAMSEFEVLISLLVDSPTDNPFRSLFAVTSALLGVFGMLRRGEILRLRNKDVSFDPNTHQLRLQVTHTKEGKTKNGKSRTVNTVIPHQYRNFFSVIKRLKEHSAADDPFIGFDNEPIHSRQLYYLLPVTRTLKAMFGNDVNFHHLRHSGVHLFMQQALHLACYTSEQYRAVDTQKLEAEVLSDKVINRRFEYWLEGREFYHVNDGILLDEVCSQIGHASYDTTRWSYLHSLETLLPVLSPFHNVNTKREFTHSELRYLLKLSATSNDLSRVLSKHSPEYAQKTLDEKRSQKIRISEHELINIVYKPKISALPSQLLQATDAVYRRWNNGLINSSSTQLGFYIGQMLKQKHIDFGALSQVWSLGSQHQMMSLEKGQITALRFLPPVTLNAENQSLCIMLACNVKNAKAFTKVFRQREWNWLAFSFELTINRKLRSDRQAQLLREIFARKKEPINIKKQPTGDTQLLIRMKPKFDTSTNILEYAQQFINQFQQC